MPRGPGTNESNEHYIYISKTVHPAQYLETTDERKYGAIVVEARNGYGHVSSRAGAGTQTGRSYLRGR